MILDVIIRRVREDLEHMTRPRRCFSEAMARPGLSIIAEIKRASPSQGVLRNDLDPLEQLRRYEAGGASAVSIVTERHFFGGSPEILRELRPQTTVPLLRKDFVVDPMHVYESALLGADAVLLIAACLPSPDLENLCALASSLGLETLVEVHCREELIRAMDLPTAVVGINNRDLSTFAVDLGTTARLLEEMERRNGRSGRLVVAESGVHNAEDARFLADLGVDGILVGEALIRSAHPELLLQDFREASVLNGPSS